jgi:hypothetical protein
MPPREIPSPSALSRLLRASGLRIRCRPEGCALFAVYVGGKSKATNSAASAEAFAIKGVGVACPFIYRARFPAVSHAAAQTPPFRFIPIVSIGVVHC